MESLTYIIEAISYSCINYAVLSPLIFFLYISTNIAWYHCVAVFFVLFIFPIIWPILYSIIVDSNLLQGHIKHPIPKAWDYFFSRTDPCFIIIHLKNGDLIGGYFGPKSFASSYPAEEDIFIERVWVINEQAEFQSNYVDGSKGVLINKSAIDYMEFF